MADHMVIRGILLAMAILAGVIIGVSTGVLTWLAKVHVAKAIIAAGAAFAGTVLLIIATAKFIDGT